MQDIEVELLPTFIVYFRSELLSPHFSNGALEPEGAFKFTNFKSGFCLTEITFVMELIPPLVSVTVSFTLKFCIPQPSAVKIWVGLTTEDLFPSPKSHSYLKGASPATVDVNVIGVPEQLPSLLKLKETTGATNSLL